VVVDSRVNRWYCSSSVVVRNGDSVLSAVVLCTGCVLDPAGGLAGSGLFSRGTDNLYCGKASPRRSGLRIRRQPDPVMPIAHPSSLRSRVVSLERARTAGSDSVNEARGHSRSLQRHRRCARSAAKPLSSRGCHGAGCRPGPWGRRRASSSWGKLTRFRRQGPHAPHGRRTSPDRRGRPPGRLGRADATRPIPDPFEYAERT